VIRSTVNWVDQRLGTNRFLRRAVDKAFPDHWSFLLGEVALYCFVTLLITGVFLTFFFTPSAKEVVYHGSYGPLDGVRMTEAYRSTVQLSFDVRTGLVIRQIHHWAALLFLGAILVHLCRIFFTGAFRRPRELNWLVGASMLVLAMVNGFFGYSLPDDLLSGTGLRIMYSVVLAIPVVGTWLAFLVFGGEFPAEDITARLYVLHILLLPALIVGLLSVHLAVVWHQKHTQFPGGARRAGNVVGSPLWPTYAAKSAGLFASVAAVLCLLGGLFQINPVWLYGPFKPAAVTTAAQPDWYMGWLEGALRIAPPWRPTILGFSISELFWPAIVLPGLTFGALFAWPFLEAKVTGDRSEHHLLDRPRDRPFRTAVGTGALAFYAALFIAGSQDLIAQWSSLPIPTVTATMRVLLIVAPFLVAVTTWRLCFELRRSDELAAAKARTREELHGTTAGAPAVGATGKGSWWSQLRERAIAGIVLLVVWLLRRRNS
jgi:ubiquinol-cytochrome c reductase cytochrome b subunit